VKYKANECKMAINNLKPGMMDTASMKTTVNYSDVVLTTIDVVDAPTGDNPKRVTFSDATVGAIDDKDAVFLCNIREVSREGEGYQTIVEFEADKLSISEAVNAIKEKLDKTGYSKALFVVHGFNTNASFHLLDCLNANPMFTKNYVIPVMWPSQGKSSAWEYKNDQKFSKSAAHALQNTLKEPLEAMTGKYSVSLVCHSSK
jgi:hypothetical protein